MTDPMVNFDCYILEVMRTMSTNEDPGNGQPSIGSSSTSSWVVSEMNGIRCTPGTVHQSHAEWTPLHPGYSGIQKLLSMEWGTHHHFKFYMQCM